MVRVTFCTPRFNDETEAVDYIIVAELMVDGASHHIEGDEAWVDLTVPVVDPESGRQLTFEENGELWARHLPTAYRAGDITLGVVEEMAVGPQPVVAGRR